MKKPPLTRSIYSQRHVQQLSSLQKLRREANLMTNEIDASINSQSTSSQCRKTVLICRAINLGGIWLRRRLSCRSSGVCNRGRSSFLQNSRSRSVDFRFGDSEGGLNSCWNCRGGGHLNRSRCLNRNFGSA
jgi:hypothetical protein